jgi:hypothetical protein
MGQSCEFPAEREEPRPGCPVARSLSYGAAREEITAIVGAREGALTNGMICLAVSLEMI